MSHYALVCAKRRAVLLLHALKFRTKPWLTQGRKQTVLLTELVNKGLEHKGLMNSVSTELTGFARTTNTCCNIHCNSPFMLLILKRIIKNVDHFFFIIIGDCDRLFLFYPITVTSLLFRVTFVYFGIITWTF